MIDDLLYEKVRDEGSKRTVYRRLNEHIEVEYEVTVKNGQDEWEIKTVTVTSNNKVKVVVDSNIIIQPPAPQPVFDDCYYYDGC